jgi:hypothetical protein
VTPKLYAYMAAAWGLATPDTRTHPRVGLDLVGEDDGDVELQSAASQNTNLLGQLLKTGQELVKFLFVSGG